MVLLFTLLTGLIKVLRYWQVLILLVALQLCAAWLLGSPFATSIHTSWDHSMIAGQLNAQNIQQVTAWDEMLTGNATTMSLVYNTPQMLASGLAYLLISIFILAGTLPLYSGLDLKFNWDRLWADAARYFRPFLGLALIAGFFYFLINSFTVFVDGMVAESMSTSDDELANFVSGALFTGGLRFLLFALVVMLFQYAKIVAATDQLRNVIYLIRRAFIFVSRHFIMAILLFSVLALVEFGFNAMDLAVWHYLLPGSATWVQWTWLIVSTFLLMMMKMSYFACQLMYFVESKRRENESGSVRLSSSSFADAGEF